VEFNKYGSLFAVFAFLSIFIYVGLMYIGWPVVGIVGGSGTIALFAWLKTTFHRPAHPMVITPLYLLIIACLMVHIIEEYLAGFAPCISRLFNVDFTTHEFVLTFAMGGYVIWILAAIGLLYRSRLANYFAWFIFVGPGAAEILHYIFPLIEGGHYHYFPGMYTAWLPMIPGIYGIYTLIKKYSETSPPQNDAMHD